MGTWNRPSSPRTAALLLLGTLAGLGGCSDEAASSGHMLPATGAAAPGEQLPGASPPQTAQPAPAGMSAAPIGMASTPGGNPPSAPMNPPMGGPAGPMMPPDTRPTTGAPGPAVPPETETMPATGPPIAADGLHDVLLVGNGVAGTVSFVDARTFENLGSVNVIPDHNEVMAAINADVLRAVAYPVVKNGQLLHHFEPSGGDRFVDDVFVSPDGETLYVSRSNLGDVAAFDISTSGHPQRWRRFVDGLKADHATISPDGKYLIVSATTANVSDVIDAQTGRIVDTFPTGDFPHQNDYSHDGKSVYNSSIGNVSYMGVSYANNASKGDRTLVKVDAQTWQVERTWVFEYGIRPNVIVPDETILYTQLSYLNGVIKYDLMEGKEIARSEQDLSAFAMETYANYDEYPHDSAHHGLALSKDGTRLCDCGTIDNTVAIVKTADMSVEHMLDVGMVPYWATNDPTGNYCFVSLSGDDAVSVIEYATGTLTKDVPVGDFPQRSRLGRVPQAVLENLDPSDG